MRQKLTRVLMTGAAVVGFSGVALAADLGDYQAPEPVDPGPAVAAPSTMDWTGFKAGVDLGWGWANADGNAFGGRHSDWADGIVGGAHVGYDYQVSPNFVVGAEADIMATDLTARDRAAGIPVENQINWMSTVRGRAGFTFDQFLVYGTGGLALAGVDTSIPGASESNTRVGYTVGAGAEAKLTDAISTRVEYLYSDFGSDTANVGGTPVSTDLDTHVLRAGLSYKF